jgi:hypothetical protein
MRTGVQWTSTLEPNASGRWFSAEWPATWHVVWYIMPTSPKSGAPQLEWSVSVERATADKCTYWINVRNLTPDPVTFEGRYAVLT